MRLARSRPAAPCVVLYYHGVQDQQRRAFARQMDSLLRWTMPVRADVVPPLRLGVRHAAVTFDDGFVSVWANAVPELAARHIPATIFVPTAWLGKPPGWGKYSAATNVRERVIARDELLHYRDGRLITIGSHSATHAQISGLTEARMLEELDESKHALEEILGSEVSLFSFPYGEADARAVALARKVGYKRVFTVAPSYALRFDDEYVTGRVAVSPDDWPVEFWLKLMGAYRWLPVASAVKRARYAALRPNHLSVAGTATEVSAE